jgi:hypothetical protein
MKAFRVQLVSVEFAVGPHGRYLEPHFTLRI